MTRRVKLATALHRTLDQRGTVPAEEGRGTQNVEPSAVVPQAGAAASAPPREGLGLGGVGRALSSAVYGVGYYSSFGIVFSAMVLWRLLPLNNALGRGFREGGQAGRATSARVCAGADRERSGKTGARRRGAEALAV